MIDRWCQPNQECERAEEDLKCVLSLNKRRRKCRGDRLANICDVNSYGGSCGSGKIQIAVL